MMEDLLYVLMGCEGNYIRFSELYDPSSEVDRLRGPDFRIAKFFDPSVKDLAMSIAEIASWYMAVRAFCEYQSGDIFGRVNQALCAGLRKITKGYLANLAELEYLVLNSQQFSLHQMSVELTHTGSLLKHAYSVCQAILEDNVRKSEATSRGGNDIEDIIEKIRGTATSEHVDYGNIPLREEGRGDTVCKGGSVLKLLAKRLEIWSGDPLASGVVRMLLQEASRPYLDMFHRWIHHGIIDDPYQEFMIREAHNSFTADQLHQDYADKYWERRYIIRTEDLPLQLSNPEVYEKVLLAGKYLNVIRECGGNDALNYGGNETEIADKNRSSEANQGENNYTSIEDTKIIIDLNAAYQNANQALLTLLIQTQGLQNRLRSLKHYFFLDRADFFINFMDIAHSELSKSSREASITKLQYLLDMALRQPGSISSEDPFKDEVIVTMSHKSLTEYLLQITNIIGIDAEQIRNNSANSSEYVRNMVLAAKHTSGVTSADSEKRSKSFTAIMGLQLDFKMPFPLSLALSRNSIMRYQFLFRHLVELKNIERSLNLSWVEQMKLPPWRNSPSQDTPARLTEWKRAAIKLRSRMLIFIQQLLYFCTVDVIEPNWSKLERELADSKTVDLLMKKHIAFLDTVIKECMLTSPVLLKIRAKLFRACQMYGNFLPSQTPSLVQIDPTCVPASQLKYYNRAINKDGQEYTPDELLTYLENSLGQYQASFDRYIRSFVEGINYSGASYSSILLTLSSRLEVCM
ncbi:Spc97p [Sugiyamaella lignohabitans]|uniref:Spindle pole body component n=1 Tax=Sugiyamaella lignohabitans TaxID=796027 RepID=A0A167DMA4_9ASCO|nr:Spc97p [Sugiyamaella lignohabitans]ANB13065.1 Spc97p [Sugiyamaella lignohabitans]